MNRPTALVQLLLCICFISATTALEAAKPVNAGAPRQEESAVTQSAKPIVLLGASYAGSLTAETLAGAPLINKGVGGEQSFEMLARFDEDVVSLEPGMVILWGFMNDITRTERSGVETAIELIKNTYLEMIARARDYNIQPVLATEVTMSLQPGIKESVLAFLGRIAGKTSYQDYINNHVIAVNEWLKGVAAEQGLMLLDLQPLLADDGGIMRKKEYAQNDGSHLTEAAYRVIVDYMEAQFDKPLQTNLSSPRGKVTEHDPRTRH